MVNYDSVLQSQFQQTEVVILRYFSLLRMVWYDATQQLELQTIFHLRY